MSSVFSKTISISSQLQHLACGFTGEVPLSSLSLSVILVVLELDWFLSFHVAAAATAADICNTKPVTTITGIFSTSSTGSAAAAALTASGKPATTTAAAASSTTR